MPLASSRLGFWGSGFPPEFTIQPINSNVGEGETVTFVINTKYYYMPNLYWTVRSITGNVNESDIVSGTISGTSNITLTGDIGGSSFSLTMLQDGVTEGDETFVVDLRTDSITGPVVATSSIVTISDFIPLSLSWSTSQSNIISGIPGGWVIENDGRSIRFVIQNSANCGGPNNSVQSGTAVATIVTGSQGYRFNPSLSGLGEAQDTNFENMMLNLNGTNILRATSAGGQQGCAANVPVIQTTLVAPPYTLQPNTTNTFTLSFTTQDNLYHVNAFYLLNLTFELL
jgi:hypothetical protein